MNDYRKESDKVGDPRRKLTPQEIKKKLIAECHGYVPTPYISPEKRVMNRVIELYQTNNFTPDEIIHSLGMLLGTAIKASGSDSKTIKGENHTITVEVKKNERD